jgi:hypothetical protein
MTIAMAAFALLISAMFVATIVASLQEAARESREAGSLSRYRVF